jgi:ABC-type multidrug transport system fused ATPase/permease subunit
VLRGLDLEIPAGGILCIVGPSGAGKTTLLSLLLRLYDPDEGSIEIDGIDLKAFHPRSVRERIALVPQDPVLLDGSLMQNIALSRPGSSRAELMEAARLAQVEDFAHSLPAGYDTQIVEGGARLSAGQRWRVALARALMRRAPVLLLDDPSAGIDLEEEPRLLAAIRGLPCARTVVMVTRAVTLAPQADRTVGLREGRIEVSAPLASLNLGAGTAAPSQEL